MERFGFEEFDLRSILVANEIVFSEPADVVEVRKALYKEIPLLIAGLKDISEGGYSEKWNIQGIKDWYSVLSVELGLPNNLGPAKPKLKYVGNRW